MNSLKSNAVLFFLLFFGMHLFMDKLPLSALAGCVLLWMLRTKDRSWILVLCLLSLSFFSFYRTDYPVMSEGTAVIVRQNYAVLENGRQRILVYTDEELEIDAVYAVDGPFTKIEQKYGFYAFDALSWSKGLGVYYSTDSSSIHFVKAEHTLMHILQEKINQIEDPQQKSSLKHILMNINEKDENNEPLYEQGFSYAGMLAVWSVFLKYFFDRRKRQWILLVLNILLLLLYHWPMLLVQSFVFRLLSLTHLSASQRTGLGLSIVLFLFPYSILTMPFLISVLYRLSYLIKQQRKNLILFSILCMQSIFMHYVNLIQTIVYPIHLLLFGLSWLFGIITLWVPILPFQNYDKFINGLSGMIRSFDINGSMMGLGALFFILLCLTFMRSKHRAEIWIGLFLVFQWSGLFHPFAEVTVINVGQGDSILIREPFNRQNILIDTGKPSQWKTLDTFLKSKSIQKINTLVITHSDNDHSGNQQNIIDTYHPDHLITSHQDVITSGKSVFYDLNTIENEDENESCIVLAYQMNGLHYLFMGDADQTTEELIAEKYQNFNCDILKLSHHGSKTGSCSTFLDTVRPSVGLISSGAYSIYHHPSPETVQNLLKRHIDMFDTKDNGDLTIIALPGFNLLLTSTGKIGIIEAL